MTAPTPQSDPHAWWDHLVSLHPPESPRVLDLMDLVRNQFKALGHLLIVETPPGADLTVALRALKDACQYAIANIACHQDELPPTGQLTQGP